MSRVFIEFEITIGDGNGDPTFCGQIAPPASICAGCWMRQPRKESPREPESTVL